MFSSTRKNVFAVQQQKTMQLQFQRKSRTNNSDQQKQLRFPFQLDSQFKTAAKHILDPPSPQSQKENVDLQLPFDNWAREEYGGVKMWVNKITGEVATQSPVELSGSSKGMLKRYPSKKHFLLEKQKTSRSSLINVTGRGMGTDCYDPSAMKELFDILDTIRNY
jgi:hypothetical protein